MMNIIKLIKMDLFSVRKQYALTMGFVLVLTTAISFLAMPILSILPIITAGSLLQACFHIGLTSKSEVFHGTLPVRRKDVIIARYLFFLITLAIVTGYSALVYKLSSKASTSLVMDAFANSMNGSGVFLMFSAFVSLSLAMTATEYFVFYVFGNKWKDAFMIGLLGAIFIALYLLKKFAGWDYVGELRGTLNSVASGIKMVAVFLGLFAVSCGLSSVYFERKEI